MAHANLLEDIELFFENLEINSQGTPVKRAIALTENADVHIKHINRENNKGNLPIAHYEELDNRLEEIIQADLDNNSKRMLFQRALGQTPTMVSGSNAIQPEINEIRILTALEKQNCNANPDKQSCLVLIENAERFKSQIGNVAESFEGPANVRLPPIVNLQPTEVFLGSNEHRVAEMKIFWWSEFERDQAESTIISIKTIPEQLGISFESTPKPLFGTNNKIHAIIDSEFLETGKEVIEVEVKIQVGNQVATTKDLLLINVTEDENLSLVDQLKLFIGIDI